MYFYSVQYNTIIKGSGITDLSQLKDKDVIIKKLVLCGSGKLDACMLSFGKHGDSWTSHKDLLFLKPLHEKSEILLPHIKGFSAGGYDFCTLQILTGTVTAADEIQLSLLGLGINSFLR